MSLSAIFDEAAARRVFPGGVFLRARRANYGSRGVWHHGLRAAISQPVTRETLYDVASLSKLFTLTAFLLAKREAKIGENRAARALFARTFDTKDKRAITLRHLMMHSAGFGLHLQRLIGSPCATWITQIANSPLESAPGEKVNYTCTAYFLLARVV